MSLRFFLDDNVNVNQRSPRNGNWKLACMGYRNKVWLSYLPRFLLLLLPLDVPLSSPWPVLLFGESYSSSTAIKKRILSQGELSKKSNAYWNYNKYNFCLQGCCWKQYYTSSCRNVFELQTLKETVSLECDSPFHQDPSAVPSIMFTNLYLLIIDADFLDYTKLSAWILLQFFKVKAISSISLYYNILNQWTFPLDEDCINRSYHLVLTSNLTTYA